MHKKGGNRSRGARKNLSWKIKLTKLKAHLELNLGKAVQRERHLQIHQEQKEFRENTEPDDRGRGKGQSTKVLSPRSLLIRLSFKHLKSMRTGRKSGARSVHGGGKSSWETFR